MVLPGDGGLLVVPGSHKSEFDRPLQLFNQGRIEEEVPLGVVNITPAAGDVVIMPECVTHGVLPWESRRPPAPSADAALPATPPPSRPHSRGSQRAAGTRNARVGRIGALYP